MRRLGFLLAMMVSVGCDDGAGDFGKSSDSAASDASFAGAADRDGGGGYYATADAGAGGGGGWGGAGDEWAGSPDAAAAADAGLGNGNTNVSLGGAQDLGYFRRLLAEGRVPTSGDFEAAGFFAEHHTPLPEPDCGERVCLQAMLGVMANLVNGNNCTMMQIGLNSPITASDEHRPPLNLVVVVDVSGSMGEAGKLEFVRSGLGQMVNELDDDDQVAIVTYENDAAVLREMGPVRRARNDLHGIIGRLQPGGGTNIYAGLEAGYREGLAAYESGRQNRLILLSDGIATQGITDRGQILELSRRYNSEGIGLTTVGLGSDFDYALMRDLATQGDGNFYFVENAAAVEEVFTEELSYFTVPVAFDVEIELHEGTDYRFVRAYGSSFWEDTEDGGRIEVPSVFLAHRVSHADVGEGGNSNRRGGGSALLVELMPVEDPEFPDIGEAQVAEVTMRFREPGSDRVVREEHRSVQPFAPGILPVRGHFDNEIVEKSFVMLNIYVGMVVAVDMFHLERRPEEAIATLRRLVAAVVDYNDMEEGGEGRDVDMALDVELLELLIDVMEQNSRPVPVDEDDWEEDPWPAD